MSPSLPFFLVLFLFIPSSSTSSSTPYTHPHPQPYKKANTRTNHHLDWVDLSLMSFKLGIYDSTLLLHRVTETPKGTALHYQTQCNSIVTRHIQHCLTGRFSDILISPQTSSHRYPMPAGMPASCPHISILPYCRLLTHQAPLQIWAHLPLFGELLMGKKALFTSLLFSFPVSPQQPQRHMVLLTIEVLSHSSLGFLQSFPFGVTNSSLQPMMTQPANALITTPRALMTILGSLRLHCELWGYYFRFLCLFRIFSRSFQNPSPIFLTSFAYLFPIFYLFFSDLLPSLFSSIIDLPAIYPSCLHNLLDNPLLAYCFSLLFFSLSSSFLWVSGEYRRHLSGF
ncbi:hypothetical protein QBC35DRAFT_271411 [Podospora australis]|uniref:Uncharacterized protein n=1 Tax=Podospora australis TaxID=1536484 RepID=A0AAN6WU80_9PEZI|nr:hypothetical protein QBC35DRAFT_271411 [Podospora australis]